MDFFSDDGTAGLGFDDGDDVIANEEFSSWLNTQVPRAPPAAVPQPVLGPGAGHAEPPNPGQPGDLTPQLASGPSPLTGGPAIGPPRKISPGLQSPKTQSATPNPYNAWKTTGNPPAGGAPQRHSPIAGTPAYDGGSMHARTPSVTAGMSRYTAVMPSQRMLQQQPPPPSGASRHTPTMMQAATPQGGALSPTSTGPGGPQGHGPVGIGGPGGPGPGPGPDGLQIPRGHSASGNPMGMQGLPPMAMGQMQPGQMQPGQMHPVPPGAQGRMTPGVPRMHPQSMSPGPQQLRMMPPGVNQTVPMPPGDLKTVQGVQGPMGMSQPQMYQPMPGQMMGAGMPDAGMPASSMPASSMPGPPPGGAQDGGPPHMTPKIPAAVHGADPRASVSSPAAPARRAKKRAVSTASTPAAAGGAVSGTPSGNAGGAVGGTPSARVQSPRPAATPGSYPPGGMGPAAPPPHMRPVSRPASSLGRNQSPQVPPSQFAAPQQMPLRAGQHAGQHAAAGQMPPPAIPQAVNRSVGPGQIPTPGPQGPPAPPGAQHGPPQGNPPRPGSGQGLHVYSLPNEVIRLSLISLSLYTQVLKYGPQSIVMREIIRRIDSFPVAEQRRMVEKFEISRGGAISELSRLPINRLLPPLFWRILLQCYSQNGLPPVPQSISLGANGPQVPLFPLFQAVQTLGGYVDTTLAGRWPMVLRMLNLPPQGPPSLVEIIWVYATTLLTFEVYASQQEPIRRQIVSQLAPPRNQSGGNTPTPMMQRANSPASAPPNGMNGAMPQGVAAAPDPRARPAASQRGKPPPTQQAPSSTQQVARVPQRRNQHSVGQQPDAAAGPQAMPQTMPQAMPQAMPRGAAMMGQRPLGSEQLPAGMSPAIPPEATAVPPHLMGAGPAPRTAANGAQKHLINGGVAGAVASMSQNAYMGGPAQAAAGAAMHGRRMPPGAGMQGMPGDAAAAAAATAAAMDGATAVDAARAAAASMQQGLPGQVPGYAPANDPEGLMNAGLKRPASGDEEGRKRARSGTSRHSDQLRRDFQGKNTFKVLLEDGKYLLQRRHSSTHGGRNIRFLTALGNEIENWRPEVAFPLDLGIVDLHAVTRSLASKIPAEVRQTLDKLIAVSANPRVHESLQHCPRLLANLCRLIMDMLEQLLLPAADRHIVHPVVASTDEEIVDDDAKLAARGSRGLEAMHLALSKYKRESKGDVVIEVDSQICAETGAKYLRTENGLSDSLPAEDLEDPEPISVDNESGKQPPPSPNEDDSKPFFFPAYGTRYQRVESEISALEKPSGEMESFLATALCDRLLLATCVLRNLSFSEANRPIIARKPEFLQLLWLVIDLLGTHDKLLDTELRTLDLCKDILTVLGNVALYIQLENPRDTAKLMLFLLSFAPVESPYTPDGDLKLMDYDIDVHRYLPNAIDVFVKIVPRENPNRKLVEEVLLGTSDDPGYKALMSRWLKAQGRDKLYPAELLSRMFALAIAMMPFTHFRPPSRDIDTRQPYLLQATMAAELMTNMIPDGDDDSGNNIALSWLESVEHFGARMVRTLNFMGMVVVNQPELKGENMRPFAKITQRGVNMIQRLFQKAKRSPEFKGSGIIPTIEHLLGGLMAAKMDKVVVKHLNALYDESTSLKFDAEEPALRSRAASATAAE